jgi:hypothetical protein
MSLLLSLCLVSSSLSSNKSFLSFFSDPFPPAKAVKVCREPVNQKFIIRVAIRIRTMLMPENLQYHNPLFWIRKCQQVDVHAIWTVSKPDWNHRLSNAMNKSGTLANEENVLCTVKNWKSKFIAARAQQNEMRLKGWRGLGVMWWEGQRLEVDGIGEEQFWFSLSIMEFTFYVS